MTSEKTTGATSRLDAGASHDDVVVDSHWASGFEQGRGFYRTRSRSLAEWLGGNEERARIVAARIGEIGVVPEGRRGDGDEAAVVDVIHLNDPNAGAAVKDTLVFRGWGSRHLYRPDMAGRRYSQSLDNRVAAKVFDHRFLEAYDEGHEPMFVSYPYVLEPEYRPFLKKLLDRGWLISLSPYGNHVRNGSLRLTFSEYNDCSEYVGDLNAQRYAIEADAYGQGGTHEITQVGKLYCVAVGSSRLFDAVFEGLIDDDGWVLARSDEGEDPLRPSIHIYFRERSKAAAFVSNHLDERGF
ncbi:hypothetical protein [Cryobacterium zhongshanensis]|uniref:Uncharacterized protein n=1 Tax=Cryobacterium zhongshanensis TaxID=2928153 RepID=A0AA41QXR9_9MICO|nr:hypothetical protein [Cryobacterium zhongshanensis]MCI4659567.1 hypothetical protein [Cryobacterium zhongshanensis]